MSSKESNSKKVTSLMPDLVSGTRKKLDLGNRSSEFPIAEVLKEHRKIMPREQEDDLQLMQCLCWNNSAKEMRRDGENRVQAELVRLIHGFTNSVFSDHGGKGTGVEKDAELFRKYMKESKNDKSYTTKMLDFAWWVAVNDKWDEGTMTGKYLSEFKNPIKSLSILRLMSSSDLYKVPDWSTDMWKTQSLSKALKGTNKPPEKPCVENYMRSKHFNMGDEEFATRMTSRDSPINMMKERFNMEVTPHKYSPEDTLKVKQALEEIRGWQEYKELRGADKSLPKLKRPAGWGKESMMDGDNNMYA